MRATDLTSLEPDAKLVTEVAIVGAGPVGLTIAAELSKRGVGVMLLEAGPESGSNVLDDQWEQVVVGRARTGPTSAVRNYGVGGTSRTWSGRVAELDPEDFAARPWVGASGWPVGAANLQEYYLRARAYVGTPAVSQAALHAAIGDLAPEAGNGLSPFLWTYSREASGDYTRFGPAALDSVDGIQCWTRARVISINTTGSQRAFNSLTVLGADGASRVVDAGCAILAAGGIENACLLLRSAHTGSDGDGRENVGRYLMDHPRGEVARFAANAKPAIELAFATLHRRVHRQRMSVTRGLTVSAEAQRGHRLLNAAMWIAPSRYGDGRPMGAPKQAQSKVGKVVDRLRKLEPRPITQARLLADGASPLTRSTALSLQCMIEQAPDSESRVTLSDRTDRAGIQVPRIDWRVSEQEADTVRWAALAFDRYCTDRRLPRPRIAEWVLDRTTFELPDVAHPIGTTRMATTARSGVVDPDCMVFGVDGLFVAGSSVFPTAGHVNPTLTAIALGVRLADHLARRVLSRRTQFR